MGGMRTKKKSPVTVPYYLALYAYKPQKTDELELRKGEMYRVIEKCQDGWFKGTSLRNGTSGVFPGNYVTPVSRCLSLAIALFLEKLSRKDSAIKSLILEYCESRLCKGIYDFTNDLKEAQDRPTATVSPLRTQNSPSRLPATVVRPHSVVSPQHIHHSPVHVIPGAQCARPMIPLTSAAAAITPPNVSAISLNGDAGGGPISSLATCSPTNTAGKAEERKNEKVMDFARITTQWSEIYVLPGKS
ncbi:UNVERIFIED_CONTAM: hypothetical protein K2H54_038776 [Gekko kuhli]